jgi:hypothetical protein
MSYGPGSYNYEGPNNPPPSPEDEPTHDVPDFPEEDTPPGTETAIRIGGDVRRVAGVKFEGPVPAAGLMRAAWHMHAAGAMLATGPGEHDSPDEGEDDVDDDDLDPQVPHSPPDGKKGPIVFDENGVAG